jgi:histidine triad (HIT) family protein
LSRVRPNTKGEGKMECIFCQIVEGKVPSETLYQDEEVIAFRDLNPQAPTHVIIIPKKHISTLTDLSPAEASLVGRMVNIANQLAKTEGISERGYRLAINCGKEGGQLVPHLHMHLIGGRRLSGALG